MEGVKNFIEVDNHSAVDVGDSKKGTKSFQLRRPKCEEEGREVSIREELTLRTEEVRPDGDHLWLIARRSTKVLKVETGRNCTITTKK